MSKTSIEWATDRLNFYTWRCNKISEGCANCYMMTMARRRGQDPVGVPEWRETALREYRALEPGDVVFVNTMSDSYHEGALLEWIQRIHTLAAQKPETRFLMLTKRIERALELAPHLAWPDNLWMGTSVELPKYLSRIDTLLQIPAAGHFVSVEPLLAPLPGLAHYVDRLGWVIVGAESGSLRRLFDPQWARDIRDMCVEAGVPFTFKQGSHFKPGKNRLLDGRTWDETPFADAPDVVQEPYQMELL